MARVNWPLLLLFGLLVSCTKVQKEQFVTIVFKHGKIAGNRQPLMMLIKAFEEANPGIRVKEEPLPASTDEQHQFYVINLEGGSGSFDVFSMDVIWVPEFARAGWLRDLTHLVSEEEAKSFFSGPMQAVSMAGRIYAVPWYIDAGILYYRKDLLGRYGFSPPKTWSQLIEMAQVITSHETDLYGFLFQGKQYEGLVCNVLEFFWGNGGDVLEGGKLFLNSKENVYALKFMRDLIEKYKIAPPLVTTATEEVTRHIFGSGKAVFMRNWPYAWNIFARKDSPISGKVGVTLLPSFRTGVRASTLGGWQLGINSKSRHQKEAEKLVKFLTSEYAQKQLSLTIGYKPTRKSLYQDRDLVKEQPFIVGLYDVFIHARPRPVSPYYMMMSQVLQLEFSAAISGIKTPEEALRSAERQIKHILQVEQ